MNDVGLDDDYRAARQELVEFSIFHPCSLPEGEGVKNATNETTMGLQRTGCARAMRDNLAGIAMGFSSRAMGRARHPQTKETLAMTPLSNIHPLKKIPRLLTTHWGCIMVATAATSQALRAKLRAWIARHLATSTMVKWR